MSGLASALDGDVYREKKILKALVDSTELAQCEPTRVERRKADGGRMIPVSVARLDRIFVSVRPAALLDLRPRSWLRMSALDARIGSDHVPVALTMRL